jgi:hypothetical protein
VGLLQNSGKYGHLGALLLTSLKKSLFHAQTVSQRATIGFLWRLKSLG